MAGAEKVQAPVAQQLVITLGQDGSMQVQGPLHDPILCFGLLEAAKEVIKDDIKRRASGPRLEIPRLVPPAIGPNNGNRLPPG